MADTIRVLIADDQALLRGSFRLLVDSTPGLVAAGEAADGAAAVRLARELRPDVVLMDLRMPVLDGIAATREICSDPESAGVRVLALTMFDLDEYVYPALRAGAGGFLLKDATPADLVAGIRTVAAGEGILSPTVTRRLIADVSRNAGPARPEPRLVGLTRREHEVLVLGATWAAGLAAAARNAVVPLVVLLPMVLAGSHLLSPLGATRQLAHYLPDRAGAELLTVGSHDQLRCLLVLLVWTAAAQALGFLRLRRWDG
ncbi:response regulator [Kitasatospora griseola]|uniref:response regulator n=1 Tax=Kitasatospora griseola TaxID=2064 RepID=UPI00166FF2B0|nr:response regulator transcription factor [Kitasatospora griseola]GGQ73387.1 hypothetical protein GCM10010195_31300 [Kitasatospora griseola]